MDIELLKKKFPTKRDILVELKRIDPMKRFYRERARWGNVEYKDAYKRILAYEKQLKQQKKEYIL